MARRSRTSFPGRRTERRGRAEARRLRAAAMVLVLATTVFAAVGCETAPEACGEYPEGGGPAVIRTRDQELCEITRQRVMQHLQKREDLDHARAEALFEKSVTWKFSDSIQDLLVRIEQDAGAEFAAAVRRAVDSVAASTKPFTADCETQRERCMTKGAAKGAYLALTARAELVRGLQPRTDTAPAGARGGGIDIDDLDD